MFLLLLLFLMVHLPLYSVYVPYGNASGSVPPLDPQVLNNNGSLFMTRPKL